MGSQCFSASGSLNQHVETQLHIPAQHKVHTHAVWAHDSFTSRAHPQHQLETVTEKWKNHRWSFYWRASCQTFTCSNAFLLLLWKDWDHRWAQGLYSCRTRRTWPLWCMAFIKERLRLTPLRQKVEEFLRRTKSAQSETHVWMNPVNNYSVKKSNLIFKACVSISLFNSLFHGFTHQSQGAGLTLI